MGLNNTLIESNMGLEQPLVDEFEGLDLKELGIDEVKVTYLYTKCEQN